MVWKTFFDLFVRLFTTSFCYLCIYFDRMLNVDTHNDFYSNKSLHRTPEDYKNKYKSYNVIPLSYNRI